MVRRVAVVIGLLLTLLSLAALPAFASSPSRGASPLVQNLGLGDALARFRAWLGGIWAQNGCTADPDGATHCGPNVVTPPGTQSHGHAPAAGVSSFSSAAAH
jgi:hypothetical protein